MAHEFDKTYEFDKSRRRMSVGFGIYSDTVHEIGFEPMNGFVSAAHYLICRRVPSASVRCSELRRDGLTI